MTLVHMPHSCLKVKRYTGFNWLGDEYNNNNKGLVADSASPFLAGGQVEGNGVACVV